MTATTHFAGNATRDPVRRGTVVSFGVAVNTPRSRDGDEKPPSFFDIVCFGGLGDNVMETVKQGMRVMIQGRFEQRTWENDDGQKRSRIEVIADEVGPSLRWATATIDRNPQESGNGRPKARSGGRRSRDEDDF